MFIKDWHSVSEMLKWVPSFELDGRVHTNPGTHGITGRVGTHRLSKYLYPTSKSLQPAYIHVGSRGNALGGVGKGSI